MPFIYSAGGLHPDHDRILMMGVVIAAGYYAVMAVGGMESLIQRLAELQKAAGPQAADITRLLPDFSQGLAAEALWTPPVLTFLVHLGVQWWAFWYPGAEPGGGAISPSGSSVRVTSVTGCSRSFGSM